MKKGLLISFEGLDYSGKDTQVEMFSEYLLKQGEKFEVLREPGQTELGKIVREILLHREDLSISPYAEQFLFLTARAQLLNEKIPLLNSGVHIILNRFIGSSKAYQGYGNQKGRESYLNMLDVIHKELLSGCSLDRTYYIDIPVNIMFDRMACSGKPQDRIEKKGPKFYERVAWGYDVQEMQDPKILRIDGTMHPEDIQRFITRDFEGLARQ